MFHLSPPASLPLNDGLPRPDPFAWKISDWMEETVFIHSLPEGWLLPAAARVQAETTPKGMKDSSGFHNARRQKYRLSRAVSKAEFHLQAKFEII